MTAQAYTPVPGFSPAPAVTTPGLEVEVIWEKRCQSCHGVDGRAHTRTGQREGIEDFTDADWQTVNTDVHLRDTITEGSRGNPKMKAFKAVLTAQEIDAVILYIRMLGARAAQRASE